LPRSFDSGTNGLEMHPYITDSDERRHVPLLIAAVAIGFSLGLSGLLNSFDVTVPGWVDITSVPLLYGVLYATFDRYSWRWPIFRTFGIVKVPVLEGRWSGYVQSSHDNHTVNHEVHVRIEQNWTRMRITLEGDLSRSHSILASVLTNAPEGTVLDYEYQNEPLPGARDAMQIHHGTARLNIVSGTDLDGYYYTGRGRGNHGRIHLQKSSSAE